LITALECELPGGNGVFHLEFLNFFGVLTGVKVCEGFTTSFEIRF